jgi:uncharacterized protein (DUF488 family)
VVRAVPHTNPSVYTVGHSNHRLEDFLRLLENHGIQAVADVRSSPFSRHVPHFNRDALEQTLKAHGFMYVFLGHLVGGRPEGDRFYDNEEHVRYDKLAESSEFKLGISRIMEGISKYRVALLCGEEDPTDCHRRLLIGRVLTAKGVAVDHIRRNGSAQSQKDLAAEEHDRKARGQEALFDFQEGKAWRSTHSVSPRRAPKSSSGS